MSQSNITVGLFGTCDNIRWRDPFMEKLTAMNVNCFNPMVDDWYPGLVHDENRHLLTDDIVVFAILRQSLAMGSLGEIGFSVLNAIRANKHRTVIVYIDPFCEPIKQHDTMSIKQSINARVLVRSKLLAEQRSNVLVVDSIEELLQCCQDAVQLQLDANNLTTKYYKQIEA
jgi:hypothetical protein